MSAKKVNKSAREVFIFVVLLFILLLTAININSFLQPKIKVLGVQTEKSSNVEFWSDFLSQHPNYIPGWIELGRTDKVLEIDPNYF